MKRKRCTHLKKKSVQRVLWLILRPHPQPTIWNLYLKVMYGTLRKMLLILLNSTVTFSTGPKNSMSNKLRIGLLTKEQRVDEHWVCPQVLSLPNLCLPLFMGNLSFIYKQPTMLIDANTWLSTPTNFALDIHQWGATLVEEVTWALGISDTRMDVICIWCWAMHKRSSGHIPKAVGRLSISLCQQLANQNQACLTSSLVL